MNPTAIKPFDNYEISPCRRYEEEDRPGHYYFEPCQPHEADVWTLYGHCPEGGVQAIADSETEKQAEELYQRITGQPFGSHEENAARARQKQAAPKLLEFAERIARMTQDGEEVEGREFIMENDDAVSTLNELIEAARQLTVETTGRTK